MDQLTPSFTTKDSGERQVFASGMQRDTQNGKPLYSLVLDGRVIENLLTSGEKRDLVCSFLNWHTGDGSPIEVVEAIAGYEGGVMALVKRYAELMTRGAIKYEPRNWMKARGPEELDRFKESALRHFMQYLAGDKDEDHAAAVVFNINGAVYVQDKIFNDEVPF